jgi:hypothetical protein
MNVDTIDFSKILFSNIKKNINQQYYLFFYSNLSTNLYVHLENISIINVEQKIDSLSVKVEITEMLYIFFNRIEKKAIEFILKNNDNVFQKNINIEKLFFSNLEFNENKYYINITSSLSPNNLIFDNTTNVSIKIIGIWIHEGLFGISYSI